MAVVIPAKNEEQLVSDCLSSVLAALDHADAGVLRTVVLVAHHCTDDTVRVARKLLAGRGSVVIDNHSPDVAGARRTGVAVALEHFAAVDPSRLWLLSTDADTTVPPDWVRRVFAHSRCGATAIAGLADLGFWHGRSTSGRHAYDALIEAGIDGETHHHAYAANLAVRADAYLDAGGWPVVPNGEEHALLAALERGGWMVRRPVDVVVTTSGRLQARAAGGLGDLLGRLALPGPRVHLGEASCSRPDDSWPPELAGGG